MARARNGAGDVGPELAAELVAQGREVTLRARGSSMAPLIQDGDVLTLSGLGRPPRKGEVVAALTAGRLLVHRVIRVRENAAELHGDALWRADGWFEHQRSESRAGLAGNRRILGRVIAQRRGARRMGPWRLGGPGTRVWLASLPLVRAFRGAARHLISRLAQ